MADTYTLQSGERPITFTIDDWAEQASGSVRVRQGDTVVLVTAVMSRADNTAVDFFPLTVDYEERYYAAGKILGSRFVRREGRPSEEAVITARLIDRAIRPLFPKHLKREVQVIVTTLSWDGEHDPDILGLLGASLALALSDIPWQGPLGAVRIGKKEGAYIINPSYEERRDAELDIVMAGAQKHGEFLLNMVEAESEEAKESSYEGALKLAQQAFKESGELQEKIAAKHGRKKADIQAPARDEAALAELRSFVGDRLLGALFTGDKLKRMAEVDALKKEAQLRFEDQRLVSSFFEEETDRLVHEAAIKEAKRVDDRKPDEIRPLEASVGVVPRTHGSGLFRRGQTTTLSLATLGGPGDHKLLDGMEIRGKKRFMHHYNFPPYAPGEVKRMMGPGRREIGHGMLAEKALLPVIPEFEEFPYTVRVVTEVLSSNGSTSQAAVCSSSLALMDAGVPIKRPVAGISMGLMADEKGNAVLLTDIQGPEDHHGDMDLKIGGTAEGITAVQLDVKVRGITEELFKKALEQAKKVREHIISGAMEKALAEPRKELSPYAPRVAILQIKPEKIGAVIGPGGKVINKMIADYGVDIDIEDTGEVYVSGENPDGVQKTIEHIRGLVREVEVGEIYQGRVQRIMDFGAFVEVLPGQDGLVHISQLAPHRVDKVTDIVNVGDVVSVKVTGIDEQGRINLSMKELKEPARTPSKT